MGECGGTPATAAEGGQAHTAERAGNKPKQVQMPQDHNEMVLYDEPEQAATLSDVPVLLMHIASSGDEEVQLQALEMLSDLVNSSYDSNGEAVGQLVRTSRGVPILAVLLMSPSPSLRQEVLVLLGNLCSNAVDPRSAETKAELLQCGAGPILIEGLYSEDTAIMMGTCGALQNLCHDSAWAQEALRLGAQPRLQELLKHDDPLMVRYSSGALRNMLVRLTAPEHRPQMNDDAMALVERRAEEAKLEEFAQRRAARVITRYARSIPPEVRLRRVLASKTPTAARAQEKAVRQAHEAARERRNGAEKKHSAVDLAQNLKPPGVAAENDSAIAALGEPNNLSGEQESSAQPSRSQPTGGICEQGLAPASDTADEARPSAKPSATTPTTADSDVEAGVREAEPAADTKIMADKSEFAEAPAIEVPAVPNLTSSAATEQPPASAPALTATLEPTSTLDPPAEEVRAGVPAVPAEVPAEIPAEPLAQSPAIAGTAPLVPAAPSMGTSMPSLQNGSDAPGADLPDSTDASPTREGGVKMNTEVAAVEVEAAAEVAEEPAFAVAVAGADAGKHGPLQPPPSPASTKVSQPLTSARFAAAAPAASPPNAEETARAAHEKSRAAVHFTIEECGHCCLVRLEIMCALSAPATAATATEPLHTAAADDSTPAIMPTTATASTAAEPSVPLCPHSRSLRVRIEEDAQHQHFVRAHLDFEEPAADAPRHETNDSSAHKPRTTSAEQAQALLPAAEKELQLGPPPVTAADVESESHSAAAYVRVKIIADEDNRLSLALSQEQQSEPLYSELVQPCDRHEASPRVHLCMTVEEAASDSGPSSPVRLKFVDEHGSQFATKTNAISDVQQNTSSPSATPQMHFELSVEEGEGPGPSSRVRLSIVDASGRVAAAQLAAARLGAIESAESAASEAESTCKMHLEMTVDEAPGFGPSSPVRLSITDADGKAVATQMADEHPSSVEIGESAAPAPTSVPQMCLETTVDETSGSGPSSPVLLSISDASGQVVVTQMADEHPSSVEIGESVAPVPAPAPVSAPQMRLQMSVDEALGSGPSSPVRLSITDVDGNVMATQTTDERPSSADVTEITVSASASAPHMHLQMTIDEPLGSGRSSPVRLAILDAEGNFAQLVEREREPMAAPNVADFLQATAPVATACEDPVAEPIAMEAAVATAVADAPKCEEAVPAAMPAETLVPEPTGLQRGSTPESGLESAPLRPRPPSAPRPAQLSPQRLPISPFRPSSEPAAARSPRRGRHSTASAGLGGSGRKHSFSETPMYVVDVEVGAEGKEERAAAGATPAPEAAAACPCAPEPPSTKPSSPQISPLKKRSTRESKLSQGALPSISPRAEAPSAAAAYKGTQNSGRDEDDGSLTPKLPLLNGRWNPMALEAAAAAATAAMRAASKETDDAEAEAASKTTSPRSRIHSARKAPVPPVRPKASAVAIAPVDEHARTARKTQNRLEKKAVHGSGAKSARAADTTPTAAANKPRKRAAAPQSALMAQEPNLSLYTLQSTSALDWRIYAERRVARHRDDTKLAKPALAELAPLGPIEHAPPGPDEGGTCAPTASGFTCAEQLVLPRVLTRNGSLRNGQLPRIGATGDVRSTATLPGCCSNVSLRSNAQSTASHSQISHLRNARAKCTDPMQDWKFARLDVELALRELDAQREGAKLRLADSRAYVHGNAAAANDAVGRLAPSERYFRHVYQRDAPPRQAQSENPVRKNSAFLPPILGHDDAQLNPMLGARKDHFEKATDSRFPPFIVAAND